MGWNWSHKLGLQPAPQPVSPYQQGPAQRPMQVPQAMPQAEPALSPAQMAGLGTDRHDITGLLTAAVTKAKRRSPGQIEGSTLGNCPSCGSDQYFSRAGSALGSGAVFNTSTGQRCEPAPLCDACGFSNGYLPSLQGA